MSLLHRASDNPRHARVCMFGGHTYIVLCTVWATIGLVYIVVYVIVITRSRDDYGKYNLSAR